MATKNGNAMTYDPQHPHAISEYGSNTYSYDANGNQTGRVVTEGSFTLTYDAENRLVQVEPVGGGGIQAPATVPEVTPTEQPTATATELAPTETVSAGDISQ